MMLFLCHPKILHKHCLQFLLGVKMVQEKLETMLMQNFGVTKKRHHGMLWYFLEWSIWSTVAGYGELCVCFYPIRNGEIF